METQRDNIKSKYINQCTVILLLLDILFLSSTHLVSFLGDFFTSPMGVLLSATAGTLVMLVLLLRIDFVSCQKKLLLLLEEAGLQQIS